MKKATQEKVLQEMKNLAERMAPFLPPSPRHPRGRNAYAHVFKCVKVRFNKSYRDLTEKEVPELLSYLRWLEEKELCLVDPEVS